MKELRMKNLPICCCAASCLLSVLVMISCEGEGTADQAAEGASIEFRLDPALGIDESDPAAAAAIAEARRTVETFVEAVFDASQYRDATFQFRIMIQEGKVRAHPWVTVWLEEWSSPDRVTGRIGDVPGEWEAVQPGQPVMQEPKQVYDWRIITASGEVIGNFTEQAASNEASLHVGSE